MESKKKRVIFFLPSSVGGAERVTVTFAKMLDKSVFDVMLVVVGRSFGQIVDFIPGDYPVRLLKVRNIWEFATLKMFRLIKMERPDIVFSSMLYLNGRVIVAGKLAGTKVVVRNNIGISKYMALTSRFIMKCLYRFSDVIVAQQEEMRSEIIEYADVDAFKVLTINNPLDVDFIIEKSQMPSPYSGTEIKFLWVARFDEEKGQDILLRAFKIVKSRIPESRLFLVGRFDKSNEFVKNLFDFVENNGLVDSVSFVGYDDNPYRWMKYCDCYVMPSRMEGLPNSLVEAMFLGRPVVASRCIPVVERIVSDGKNGYVVPSEDVESMADKMVAALHLKVVGGQYAPVSEAELTDLFVKI